MNPRATRALTLGRAIAYEVRTERLTFMAGSIAYGAFVSLLPLFLLVLSAVSATGNGTLRQSVIAVIQSVLTPGAGEVIVAELEASTQLASLSIVGVLVLIWGTLRIFRGLDTAFSDIYESEAANTFADQLTDGVVVLITVALAVVAGALIESSLPELDGALGWVVYRSLLVVVLFVTFYPMYYIFPDEDVTYIEVVPGTLVAAVGLTTFESLFRLYVQFSSRSPESSVVAGILVLLTWLYFSGLVILLGAAVNAVLSNRSRDVNVRPLFGGVPLDSQEGGATRRTVVTAIQRFDHLVADNPHEDVEVRVGDETVVIPTPEKLVVDTDVNRFFPEGPVRLELRWSSWPDSKED
ncbi:YihY/virulence factor BrkB family protein [Haloferax mediterranei ATCC 33500]|uniref:Ribonuclease BN-like protein n=1 Tax=Haloferax mediterranei (strain ATCC 33500 / DSM 1411 / JCM 8866 / NBRC 14739 / NCIMB 2177 / R-4) TaxID=523841 RepID=I3R7R4_HALMT|nr:YihY/virulence factor BrkB family protein [Haloferax mediterranei]AFK20274.1 ribonuclease BN-like protein [Haloferax mediterranei ATCC 33500]ELZ99130.1 ribonuclease BN-like protein [Haloferax mediterranei ATCC 33500]MDX5986973.1 YihY/virulence factor BrkB family protein [Haloferax mediterranei ATCC 33500]QCQ76290.1 YihY/virulence factor BrkB family protein [Haloferax mediterranei ATCC 33500]